MVTNVDWFFISHRLVIAQEAVKRGWKVYVACEDTGRGNEIGVDGINYIDFKFSRSGRNPFQELKTILDFLKLYRKIAPDVVHHITLKPVIYGTLIAKFLRIKGVVNAVSGLGYNFTRDRRGITQRMMLEMMKFGFKRDNLTIIFQNENDQEELTNFGVVHTTNKIVRIKGSGVDLDKFKFSDLPVSDKIKVLFPSRMLWDKGVKELREATNLLKERYQDKIQIILVGMVDDGNKAGVSSTYLNDWQDGEYVTWIGYQKNMVNIYNNSHIVVLPSYREGMPKTLIEACAVGRAIVTTDAIGCRECVDEGENGFKVPVYNVEKLVEALTVLFENDDMVKRFGLFSRIKAEKEFDVKNVVKKHLEIYEEINS